MTRLAVGRPTLAVSPQNGTKSLRRPEIKIFLGGTCPPTWHPAPIVHTHHVIIRSIYGKPEPPFQNPRSATDNSRDLAHSKGPE